jgi:RND superfamily putative drug exporter
VVDIYYSAVEDRRVPSFYNPVEGDVVTRLSGWLLRHKRIVLLSWLVVLAGGVALTPTVNQRMSTDFSVPGQPGYQANLAISETYGSGGHAQPTVAVITLPPGVTVDSPGVTERLRRAFGPLARDPDARVASYATTGDRRFVSGDRRTTYALVSGGDPVATVEALPPGTTVRVTGIDQLTGHGTQSPGAEVVNLTLIGAVGALAVLALVFGSLLALAPLLVAAVAILATLLLVGLLTVVTDVNLIVEYLVALIGLGVAIDYSLLLVTRWREERAAGHAGERAVHRAMATAGRSVLLSGSTVAIGLLSLVVLPVPFLRSVGYAGMLIPLVSALVTITLLPVLLAAAGHRLDWPRRRSRREAASSRAWTAWARGVVRARWAATVVSVAALAVLGAFALDVQVGQARAGSLATTGAAADGLARLRQAGVPAGVLTPIEVLVPSGADPGAVAARLAGVPGVWTAVAPDRPAWRRGGTALVQVQPLAEPGTRAGQQAIRRIRAAAAQAAPRAQVGGAGAEDLDLADAVYGQFPRMVAVIAAITFVLLARAFRSLLLAAKAVAVDLLSIAAVLGAVVVVWQQGHGSRAIAGVPGTGALDAFVPLFVFAFLFGLSMDYEVFLLARMREAYDRTGSTTHAVVEGVGRTGRLVTSAALILFLAFTSLAGAADTVTKIFATGLGAGILLDATVVRSLLVPALVSLLGRWNWWLPAWAARPLRVAPSAAPAEPAAGDQLARAARG